MYAAVTTASAKNSSETYLCSRIALTRWELNAFDVYSPPPSELNTLIFLPVRLSSNAWKRLMLLKQSDLTFKGNTETQRDLSSMNVTKYTAHPFDKT
eukprot:IDg22512t1